MCCRQTSSLPARPIKILRVIARLNVGGPAIQTVHLSRALSEGDFKTTLVCGRISLAEGDMAYLAKKNGVRPVYLEGLGRELSLFKDLATLFQLRRLIMTYRPDIVHTHTAKAGTLGRMAAMAVNRVAKSQRRIKLIHTFHGHVFHGYFGKMKTALFLFIERALALKTDALVAISESQKRELVQTYRIAEAGRFRSIALGFDLAPFLHAKKRRGVFRKSMHLGPEEILVGLVGRMVPIKNHALFIEAARILCLRRQELPLRFVVVGDGELRSQLEAQVRRAGLGKRFVFTGWVRDMPDAYADLDILALTSINEGTPVSIIEAMAASVPVVATDAGGVRDLLGNPLNEQSGFRVCKRGIRCDQNAPEQFAWALEHQLTSEETEKSARLKQARDFVTDGYSNERLVRDIVSLYLELLSADCTDRSADQHQ